jgi:hypothetical protein
VLERLREYRRTHPGSKVQLSIGGVTLEDLEARAGEEDDDADADSHDRDVKDWHALAPLQVWEAAVMTFTAGLGGLIGMGSVQGGRRRKRGELMKTKDGVIISKHDSELNGRINAADLTRAFDHAGDLEEVRPLRVTGHTTRGRSMLTIRLCSSWAGRHPHPEPGVQPAEAADEEGRVFQGHGGPGEDRGVDAGHAGRRPRPAHAPHPLQDDQQGHAILRGGGRGQDRQGEPHLSRPRRRGTGLRSQGK